MAKANLESTSRRALLKGATATAAAVAALAAPALAGSQHDPIFALIEATKAARKAYAGCFKEADRAEQAVYDRVTVEAHDAFHLAQEASDAVVRPYRDAAADTLNAVAEMPATTLPGMIAALEFLATVTEGDPLPDGWEYPAFKPRLPVSSGLPRPPNRPLKVNRAARVVPGGLLLQCADGGIRQKAVPALEPALDQPPNGFGPGESVSTCPQINATGH